MKKTLSLLLAIVISIGMIPAFSVYTEAAEIISDTPDVIYEESFNSGLWTVEPKTVSTGYSEYNYTPSAPTVTDGTLQLQEGNSAAFWWNKINGVKESGTYTLSFDVEITDTGNNKSLISETIWKRELFVGFGGYANAAAFRSCGNNNVYAAGSGFGKVSDYKDGIYSVNLELDNTVTPNKITATVTKGDFSATKTSTIDNTAATYGECSGFWVFRCEDGAAKISNFSFTDGNISISGFESIDDSSWAVEEEGLWTLESKPVSTGYSEYDYTPTAPIGYNGRLYLKEGNAVALWWKKLPGVKDKGIYTLSFDVDITNTGDNKSLISEAIWKRELNVALGGSWSAASFRNDTKKLIASGSGFTDASYASDTYSVKIVWDNTASINTVSTTITKGGESLASKNATVSSAESWYDECSEFWSFRCEDGAAEISNLKFTAINA